MKVVLTRRNSAVHFEAVTESGARLDIDGAPAIGGLGLGARPMEVVLSALGGCSSMDVVSILEKQRATIGAMQVTVSGERVPDAVPSLFRTVHVHFDVTTDAGDAKVARAVALSMETYCTVTRIVEKTAAVTFSHTTHASPARTGEVPGDEPTGSTGS